MNYFEIFGFPVQLKIDKTQLKKKYFELSRLYHPDHHAQQAAGEQQAILERSAVLNKAFRTFSNEEETIRYVLELKGLLEENEKYNLPPAFLMEMMELNEEAAEAALSEAPGAREAVEQKVAEAEEALYQPVRGIIEGYREGAASAEALQQVKAYYFKKKYIQRLKGQMGEKL